jgi:type IV pilus assembly protein PilN
MIEINLLPVREARRKADIRQQVMQLVLVVLVAAGVIGFVHSRMRDQISMAQMRVSQMEHDIEQFKPQLEQVAAFKKQKAKLQRKIDIIEGLDRARKGPVRVMSEIAKRAPERLWLTSLGTKGNHITMQGESLDNELVALFLGDLGDSRYFDNVDLDSTKMEQSKSGGLKVVDFSITAELVDPSQKRKSKNKKKKKNRRKGAAAADDASEGA